MEKFKKGAASFYIVAFSTLILLILAVSFATVIIAEMERTSNDDLSQSAYDSAMAGVEDAKLAFYNYQNCKTKAFSSMSQECKEIVAMMESPEFQNCYMVGRILGRIEHDAETEVPIQEYKTTGSGKDNNMQQAYTCVKIQTVLSDYRSTLSASNPTRVVKVSLDDGAQTGTGYKEENRVAAKDIKKVKISWYSGTDNKRYTNFAGGSVVFPRISVNGAPVPPTISVALVQTAKEFKLSDFETAVGGKTDRGMLYLVPSNVQKTSTPSGANYKVAVGNKIGASAFSNSNLQESKNLPYVVHCSEDGEFACAVTIDLPEPIGGERSNDTFMFVVGLPYGRPTTDFALELFCADGKVCARETVVNDDGTETVNNTNQANFSGVQVKIDSTGRANDLFRRVEVRMESAADNAYISMLGPLELIKDEDGGAAGAGLEKDYTVTREWNITTPSFVGRH